MSLPPLPCACANLRRASRAVTQVYEEELRPTGLRITQLAVLKALATVPGLSQGSIAHGMGLDSTTLTRILALLRRKGLVSTGRGRDKRHRLLSLTPKGQAKVEEMMPYWERAQTRIQEAIGKDYDQLQGLLHQVAVAVGPK